VAVPTLSSAVCVAVGMPVTSTMLTRRERPHRWCRSRYCVTLISPAMPEKTCSFPAVVTDERIGLIGAPGRRDGGHGTATGLKVQRVGRDGAICVDRRDGERRIGRRYADVRTVPARDAVGVKGKPGGIGAEIGADIKSPGVSASC